MTSSPAMALDQALAHAPAIAWVDVDRTEDAARVASAAVAGGFRALAISASVPDADDVVATFAARPDTVLGLALPRRAEDVGPAVAAGASFVVGADVDPTVGEAAREAGAAWFPGVLTANEVAAARRAGAERVHLYPAGAQASPAALRLLRRAFPDLRFLAGGGIAGDRIHDWVAAGAEAVLLAGAIYSPALLAAGDLMTVRNHAAAVHRAATRARVAGPAGAST